jgi:hypothetical protein
MSAIRRVLNGAALLALAQTATAGDLAAPALPPDLRVPQGHELYLAGHAIGTQDYVCLPSTKGIGWSLFTPQATLFGRNDRQVMTHYFSPDPEDNDTLRATWQDSDSSMAWARVVKPSTDPAYVQAGAIPWVLLEVVGARKTSDGETVADATFVQRVRTTGGAAPSAGCASSADVGRTAAVPYTADYLFYRRRA